jgi:hypothetical protein
MDGHHFDALTRTLGRRGLLQMLLGAAGVAGLDPEDADAAPFEFCDKKPKGRPCRRKRQCCSHDCKRKKGKKQGKCACSPLRAPCTSSDDCCPPDEQNALLPTCGLQGSSSRTVCCMPGGGVCDSPADCCGTTDCTNGHCVV